MNDEVIFTPQAMKALLAPLLKARLIDDIFPYDEKTFSYKTLLEMIKGEEVKPICGFMTAYIFAVMLQRGDIPDEGWEMLSTIGIEKPKK